MRVRSALALAVCSVCAAVAPAAAATPAAHVWVTTPDGAMKLADRGAMSFRPGGSDALTISVDPSRRYQTMDGFGASITDSSARVLSGLRKQNRDAAMQSLFRDDRLSFLRQPIGASDFVAGDFYTYDDVASEPHKTPDKLGSAGSGSRSRDLATPWWADGMPKHADDPTWDI